MNSPRPQATSRTLSPGLSSSDWIMRASAIGRDHEAAVGAIVHRELLVAIGKLLSAGEHEKLPGHIVHRVEKRDVVHIESAQLAVHHRPARLREIDH